MNDFALFLMRFSSDILPHVMTVVVAFVVALLIFVLRKKIVRLISAVVKRLTARFTMAEPMIEAFQRPAEAFLVLLSLYSALAILAQGFFPDLPQLTAFLLTVLKIGLIVCLTWGAMGASDPAVKVFRGNHDNLDQTIVSFTANIVKVILVIISMVIIIDEIGYNISGLITGLGLGGLTFALAAQDTASNFFGGVVIITDKPFQVGDWIQTTDLEGVVTDISLRSTRIRTFKDAEIIVPNSTLANMAITNWSRMNKRKVEMTLRFTCQTSAQELRQAEEAVRQLIQSHPKVDPEGVVVAFSEFASDHLSLTAAYFVLDTVYKNYVTVKEEINFSILDCLQQMGIALAYPTQRVWTESSPPKPLEP